MAPQEPDDPFENPGYIQSQAENSDHASWDVELKQ